ncbi:hypothetical protein D3C84_1060720 [compost metagenome]
MAIVDVVPTSIGDGPQRQLGISVQPFYDGVQQIHDDAFIGRPINGLLTLDLGTYFLPHIFQARVSRQGRLHPLKVENHIIHRPLA